MTSGKKKNYGDAKDRRHAGARMGVRGGFKQKNNRWGGDRGEETKELTRKTGSKHFQAIGQNFKQKKKTEDVPKGQTEPSGAKRAASLTGWCVVETRRPQAAKNQCQEATGKQTTLSSSIKKTTTGGGRGAVTQKESRIGRQKLKKKKAKKGLR